MPIESATIRIKCEGCGQSFEFQTPHYNDAPRHKCAKCPACGKIECFVYDIYGEKQQPKTT